MEQLLSRGGGCILVHNDRTRYVRPVAVPRNGTTSTGGKIHSGAAGSCGDAILSLGKVTGHGQLSLEGAQSLLIRIEPTWPEAAPTRTGGSPLWAISYFAALHATKRHAVDSCSLGLAP